MFVLRSCGTRLVWWFMIRIFVAEVKKDTSFPAFFLLIVASLFHVLHVYLPVSYHTSIFHCAQASCTIWPSPTHHLISLGVSRWSSPGASKSSAADSSRSARAGSKLCTRQEWKSSRRTRSHQQSPYPHITNIKLCKIFQKSLIQIPVPSAQELLFTKLLFDLIFLKHKLIPSAFFFLHSAWHKVQL